jgi:short-subunit dehydrogenase
MSTAKGAILITGANGGLVCAIVEQIASQPELSVYHGLYTVRDATSSPALATALGRGASSHSYDTLSLDLTKLGNVRQVAEDINVSHPILSRQTFLFLLT